jgi:hypothetical protein
MSTAYWLLVGTTALAWYHVGFVWLVQVVAWPLFAYVGPNEFPAYHQAWWRGIRYVLFIPTGLVFAGGLALLFVRPSGVPAWLLILAFGLNLVMWILTAGWWGPQQSRLTDPRSPRVGLINRTHWLRTALVSGYALAWLAALVSGLQAHMSA